MTTYWCYREWVFEMLVVGALFLCVAVCVAVCCLFVCGCVCGGLRKPWYLEISTKGK